jgi:catechol 2,3-dioxygenase-like lactoylglutathione lyase family enzyme
MRVWYQVRDLDAGRGFYRDVLGFTETNFDGLEGWSHMERGEMQIALAKGEPIEGGVAMIDVTDVKEEARRLRANDVQVGVVVELHGQMRLLDVYDPDGNRIQLAQELDGSL